MKRENNPLILCLFGILPVVWLGLLIAPAVHRRSSLGFLRR